MYNIERAPPTSCRNSWYKDVHQYLDHDTIPSHFSLRKKRALQLKDLPYQLVHKVIYRKHSNKFFLKCLEALDLEKVLHDLHDRLVRGHFEGNSTMPKLCQPVSIGPHYSRTHMPMPAISQSFSDAPIGHEG